MRHLALTFLVGLITLSSALAQGNVDPEHKKAILEILTQQQEAWSSGDIEGFMEGYWKSDSLKFYNSGGVTLGWSNILQNYKERYPTKAHTGNLRFKINDISRIETQVYYIMGEYFLDRALGEANGIFMIVFKKIDGKWKIIADTSC